MTVFVSRETEEVMSESEFIRPKTKDLEIKVPFVSENDQLEPPPLVNYFGKRSKTVCVCVCVKPCLEGFFAIKWCRRGARPPATNLVQRS